MDVKMPDGTIIKNVPEGTTKSELQRRYEKMQGGAQTTAAPQPPGIPSPVMPGPDPTGEQPGMIERAAEAYGDWWKRGGVSGMLGIEPFDERPAHESVMGFAGPTAMTRVGGASGLIDDFARLKVDPNLPAVAQNRAVSSAANVLQDAPIAGGPITKGVQKGIAQTAQAADDLASKYGAATTAEKAGQAVQKGVSRFADESVDAGNVNPALVPAKATSFATKASKLYESIPINPTMRVGVNNTFAALDDVTKRFPSSAELGKQFQAPLFRNLAAAVEKSKQGIGLTWDELKHLRTLVGEQMRGLGRIDAQVSDKDWSRLYGAISKDMEEAAKAAGPKAFGAWQRANNFYRSGATRISENLKQITKAASPEKAYERLAAATKSGSRGDLGMLRSAKRSLRPDEWGDFVSYRIREMGKPTAGRADVLADVDWSPASFMTEWNKMTPQARDVLFSGPGMGEWRAAMDSLANVAQAQKNVAALGNPSGSGRFANTALLVGGAAYDLPTTVGVLMGGRIASEAMMNPAFVRWLAQTAKSVRANPTVGLPGAVARLGVMSQTNKELRPYYEALSAGLENPPE